MNPIIALIDHWTNEADALRDGKAQTHLPKLERLREEITLRACALDLLALCVLRTECSANLLAAARDALNRYELAKKDAAAAALLALAISPPPGPHMPPPSPAQEKHIAVLEREDGPSVYAADNTGEVWTTNVSRAYGFQNRTAAFRLALASANAGHHGSPRYISIPQSSPCS